MSLLPVPRHTNDDHNIALHLYLSCLMQGPTALMTMDKSTHKVTHFLSVVMSDPVAGRASNVSEECGCRC